MQPLDQHPILLKGLRQIQLIVGALLIGVLVFLALLVALGPLGRDATADGERLPLTWILLGTAALEAIVVAFLRASTLDRGRRRIAAGEPAPRALFEAAGRPFLEAGDAGRLFLAWSMARIVGAAGFEAAALLSLVAFLLEGMPESLVAAGVFALLLAYQMPTRGRLDEWLSSELLRLRTMIQP